MRTLFWHPTGPLMKYDNDGILHIEALNPQSATKWRMSRWEMLTVGLRFVAAAIRAPVGRKP
jgi:hypothetical protein